MKKNSERGPPMEKYGVACKCAEGSPPADGMVKLADGTLQCKDCGRVYKLDRLQLKDEIRVEDRGMKPKS